MPAMGALKIEAIAPAVPHPTSVIRCRSFNAKNLAMFEFATKFGHVYACGTGGGVLGLYQTGALPVKNYTTNIME